MQRFIFDNLQAIGENTAAVIGGKYYPVTYKDLTAKKEVRTAKQIVDEIITGAAALAAAAGVYEIGKSALNAYSDFQQLTGGVETLFKDSAGKVEQYAANAFQTAGMSANQYMETVTSFSASLLQSMGGDTAAAADKANLALTDMSDNANKMGTSMELIQNAYGGFAKQNYTMLDNLKLGKMCQIAQYKPCENGETLAS